MEKKKILVSGGGLIGPVFARTFNKLGFNVTLFEKRKDPRKFDVDGGRSINIALMSRGVHALKHF
jgi:kynurenine 3-monooxygenase